MNKVCEVLRIHSETYYNTEVIVPKKHKKLTTSFEDILKDIQS